MNSRLRSFWALPLLLGFCVSPALAQNPSDSTRAALDSLNDRLERAEQAIERLTRQLQEQDQAKVQSRSRNRVELSGLILFNGWYNDARVNNTKKNRSSRKIAVTSAQNKSRSIYILRLDLVR